ncbi:MAG: heme-copper oxidase subunit III [Bernardetiaceae bacterium]
MSAKKDTQPVRRRPLNALQHIEKQHPYVVMLYVGMIGISAMFLFLLFSFRFYEIQEEVLARFRFPTGFVISTCLLLMSSLTIHQAKLSFYEDDFLQMRRYLLITLGLGIGFSVCQVVGWYELQAAGLAWASQNSTTYLYLVSGLHVLHLLGGLAFVGVQAYSIHQKCHDPVKVLIAVTNPHEKMKLTLMTLYWHFMDGLWVVLFLYFVMAFLF